MKRAIRVEWSCRDHEHGQYDSAAYAAMSWLRERRYVALGHHGCRFVTTFSDGTTEETLLPRRWIRRAWAALARWIRPEPDRGPDIDEDAWFETLRERQLEATERHRKEFER